MQDPNPFVAGFAPSAIAMVGIIVGIIFFFMVFLTAILKQRQKEITVREIAAYVAEGSITSEDAERILRGSRPWHELRDIARSSGFCDGAKVREAARRAARA
jgi:hypothetical protein